MFGSGLGPSLAPCSSRCQGPAGRECHAVGSAPRPVSDLPEVGWRVLEPHAEPHLPSAPRLPRGALTPVGSLCVTAGFVVSSFSSLVYPLNQQLFARVFPEELMAPWESGRALWPGDARQTGTQTRTEGREGFPGSF